MRILVCWLAGEDIQGAERLDQEMPGPLGTAIKDLKYSFDRAVVLTNPRFSSQWIDVQKFVCSLVEQPPEIEERITNLENPTDFTAIFMLGKAALEDIVSRYPQAEIYVNLSSGTRAMAAVWPLLLASTEGNFQLVQTSLESGVDEVDLPVQVFADALPDVMREQARRIGKAVEGASTAISGFENIIGRSSSMRLVVEEAKKVSIYPVHILIQGETGTGKEVFARAIHKNYSENYLGRSEQECPFVPVNCGAIPSELIESEFFGHKKGAFTGATQDREGHFEAAMGGTIFLDEVGELPLSAQTRLLRVLQEKEIVRVGDSKVRSVEGVRVIAATNRNLLESIKRREFREDLYYRLRVIMLSLPPLRHREGDLQDFISQKLLQIARDLRIPPKTLTANARRLLSAHLWPGNVRELEATIQRLLIMSDSESLTDRDVDRAVEKASSGVPAPGHILPIEEGFRVKDELNRLKREYARQALEQAGGNASKAGRLLGLTQQAFAVWKSQI